MARKNIFRTLPPLEEALKTFCGFSDGKSRRQVITEELRTLAKRLRRTKPTPFYSMREIAGFFETPISTISAVFQTLEREGFLSRLRGSHTLLLGKKSIPQDLVRGVVGIPVWFDSIMVLPYTRAFTMMIEEKLRKVGFVADIIFHQTKTEESQPEFAQRLLAHRLDAVVWHSPYPGVMQNVLSLRERGVRILLTGRSDSLGGLPVIFYPQEFSDAYRELARCWKKAGIRKIWIWSPLSHLHGKAEAEIFILIMKEHGIGLEWSSDSPAKMLENLRRENAGVGIAFMDTTNSEAICNVECVLIAEIASLARIAFCAGTIRAPYLNARGVRADAVTLSPDEMAAQFAEDIGRLEHFK